jgi:hypothetical protein
MASDFLTNRMAEEGHGIAHTPIFLHWGYPLLSKEGLRETIPKLLKCISGPPIFHLFRKGKISLILKNLSFQYWIVPFITHLYSILNDSTGVILAALRLGMRPANTEVTITMAQNSIRLQRGMEN